MNNSNVIRMLQTSQGIITTHDDIAETLCAHYSSIFNSHRSNVYLHCDVPACTTISHAHSLLLDANVTDIEILIALKGINENKSPGSNGFNSQFFLQCWDLVWPQFLLVVHHFFIHSKLPDMFKYS